MLCVLKGKNPIVQSHEDDRLACWEYLHRMHKCRQEEDFADQCQRIQYEASYRKIR